MPSEEAQGFRCLSAWSQEDLRYIKNAGPTIAPVSYPPRVAPLPEDKVPDEGKDEKMEAERRPTEASSQVEGMRRRMALECSWKRKGIRRPFRL